MNQHNPQLRYRILAAALAVVLGMSGWLGVPSVFGQSADTSINQISLSASLFGSDNRIIANGTYEVRFGIYPTDRTTADPYPSDSDAGTRLWAETQTVTVQNGIFRAFLGSVTPLPATLTFAEGDYYIGIRIGTDSEMTPRKKLGSVPSAVNSQFLQGTTIGTAGGNLAILDANAKFNKKLIPKITKLGTVNVGIWEGEKIAAGFLTSAFPYLAIGDGTPSSIDEDGDLYITDDLEVDGTIYGTFSGTTIGTVSPGFTQGSVVFTDSTGSLAQDNANFFWDDATNRLGIGDTSPAATFTVGSGDLFQINSTGAITAATGITSSDTITFSGLSTAGIVTNTAGGVLGTTATVPVASGGTGVDAGTVTDGQILIGHDVNNNFSLAALTQGSGITVTNGAGSITIASTLGTSVDLASEITGTLPVANGGTGATALTDLIALTTHTTGNYVATITAGNGISGSSSSEGGTPTIALGALTADWNQTGAFNISLNNVGAGLKILENGATPTLFGIFDVADLTTTDKTYTFPDASGTVLLSGQTLFTAAGTSGSSQAIAFGDTLTIAAGTGITTTGGATDTVTIAATLGTSIAAAEVDADALDFTEFKDSLTLDAATDIALGSLTLSTSGTGAVSFNNTGLFTVAGNIDFNGTGTNDIAGTLNLSGNALTSSGALTVTPAAGSNLNIALSTTGDFAINSNQLYVDTSAGNVGIGTTAPSAQLHVSGANAVALIENTAVDSNSTMKVKNDVQTWQLATRGAGGLSDQFIIRDETNGVDALAIQKATGNVGIGTTGPGVKLHVSGQIGAPATSGTTQTGVFRIGTTDTAFDNVLDFGGYNAAPYGMWIQATNEEGLDNTYPIVLNPNGGNVGIGTISPAGKLHVAGNVSASAWGTSGIQYQGAAATFTDFSTAVSGTATNAVFTSFAQPTLAASNTGVITTNASTLYVANAPAAGTNQTISNAYSLWVDDGTARFDGTGLFSSTLLAAANTSGFAMRDNSGTLELISGAQGGNAGFKIRTGVVYSGGVGTVNATALDVGGFGHVGAGTSAVTGTVLSIDSDALHSSYTAPSYFLNVNGGSLVVDGSGYVGIGTASPGSALDVKGTLRLSGATSGYVGFAPAATAGSTTYTLPSADGTSGQALTTNASGVLSWNTISTSQWTTTGSDIYYTTGNVGIGDASPDSQLDILSSAAAHNYLTLANTNAGSYNPGIQFELAEGTKLFTLGVDDSDSDKFKIYAGNDISGTSQFTIDSTGLVSIADLNLGAQSFDTNAGVVSWVDMPITSAASIGTVESYSAQIDGTSFLTIYAQSDGSGSITSTVSAVKSDVQLDATADGLATKVNAGACSDTTFTRDTDGTLCIDSTNGRIYFRYGAAWHYAAQTAGFQIPTYETYAYDFLQNAFDESQPLALGDFLIPFVESRLDDNAVHGLYARFSDVKDTLFAEEKSQIADISLKTDQNITTLAQLQTSVDAQLTVIGTTLNEQSAVNSEQAAINSQQLTVDSTQDTRLMALEALTGQIQLDVNAQTSKVSLLETQMQTLIDFYTTFDLDNLIAKDTDGNVDLLDGTLRATVLETGALVIEVVDPLAPTIGMATILPVAIDTDNDGNDDYTDKPMIDPEVAERDGTVVRVMTRAMVPMVNGSKIFTSWKGNPGAFSWIEKIKDDNGDYVGFKIRLSTPIAEEVKVDWWLVAEK